MSATSDHRQISILFILTSAGIGGAETQAVSLLNGLNPQRFRLSFAYLKDESDLLIKIDRSRVRGSIFCCGVTKKIDWRAMQLLVDCIKNDAVDIIVCTNMYPLFYAWASRLMSRRSPRIVEIFHSTSLPSVRENLQMLLYWPICRLSNMLIYVCENQRKYWRARLLGSRQESVVHNGVDTVKFCDEFSAEAVADFRSTIGFSQNDYVIGLCAYMRPEKAHGDLLDAINLARSSGMNVKCLLIGDGPERKNIEAKVRQMHLQHLVLITGLISDVRPAIAACDALVIASHHIETFSIAALEAMAMGKPMIMTDIGGASEQIEHAKNGFLYHCGDIISLRNCIVQLADSPLRKDMGIQARFSVVHKFSLAAMIDAYDHLFSSLMLE